MGPSSWYFFYVLLLLFRHHAWSTEYGCVQSEIAVNNYTCSFEYNKCGWKNNNDNNFNWTRANNCYYDYCCLVAKIKNRNVGEMARLESLSICSSATDKYFLNFEYEIAMEQINICRLRVDLLNDDNGTTNLLQDDTGGVNTFFSYSISSHSSFQIVFTAVSLNGVHNIWCRIYIDNIRLTHETVTTPRASAVPPMSMTTLQKTSAPHPDTSQTFVRTSASAPPETSVTPSNAAEQNPQTAAQSQDGLPPGAVIGIVVGLVVLVIIAAVCTLVILVARRRASGGEVHLPWIFKNLFRHSGKAEPRNGVFAVENSAYVCDDDCIPVREYPMKEPLQNDAPNCNRANSSVFGDYYSVPHDTPGNDPGASATSDYAVADGSSDYYAMPVNDTSDVKTKTEFNPHVNVATGAVNTISGRKGVKQKRGDTTEYELAAVIGSDAGYSTPDDVDLKAGRRELQRTGRTHVDGTKRNDYNKLSFQTPSSAAVKNTQDTYNHLQEQNNVYNVPKGDDSEYSPAGNPDKAGAQLAANAAQNHRYENVDERGKPVSAVEAGTEYNHLNIKTGHPSVTESRSPPSDVYNHLDETVQGQPSLQADDEYNKVDFNERTREADEADEDGTYNHLDTLQD